MSITPIPVSYLHMISFENISCEDVWSHLHMCVSSAHYFNDIEMTLQSCFVISHVFRRFQCHCIICTLFQWHCQYVDGMRTWFSHSHVIPLKWCANHSKKRLDLLVQYTTKWQTTWKHIIPSGLPSIKYMSQVVWPVSNIWFFRCIVFAHDSVFAQCNNYHSFFTSAYIHKVGNKLGNTPLHWSIENRHFETTRRLAQLWYCMCAYIYIYIYIYMYEYIHTYTCKYKDTYIYVHIHIYTHVYSYINIHIYVCTYIYIAAMTRLEWVRMDFGSFLSIWPNSR